MEEKAVRGFSWTFLGLGINKALATITTIVLAALLSPAEFGLVAIALIVVNFVSWFGGSSFGLTLIVHQRLDARGEGTVLSLSLLGAAAAGTVTLALAPVIADILAEPELTALLAALSASVLIGGVTGFYEALLQNRLEFRRRFVALTLQTAAFTSTAITLAALGGGAWSLVVAQLLSTCLFAAVLVALAPRRVRPTWDREQAGTLFRTGRGFALQGITAFFRQNADVVAVGRSFGATSVGFYTMAFRLGDLTYSALADPIARVTFPAFARSRAREEDIRPAFLKVLRLVAVVTVPCGAILSAASDPVVRALFDREWTPMVGVLAVVGLWAAIRPIESTLGWLLNSLGHANAVGRVAVLVLVPLVAGLVLAVDTGDLVVVACVPLADTLLSLAILVVLVGRHADLRATTLGRAVAPILVAGAACWVATRVAADYLEGVSGVPALTGAVAAGTAAFVLVLLLVDRPLVGATIAQVARLLGRDPPTAPDGSAEPRTSARRPRVSSRRSDELRDGDDRPGEHEDDDEHLHPDPERAHGAGG